MKNKIIFSKESYGVAYFEVRIKINSYSLNEEGVKTRLKKENFSIGDFYHIYRCNEND